MKKILSIPFATLFLFSLVSRGQEIDLGPEIGTELCSCSPSTYEFTLDFDLSCPPVNITIGNAVEATSCLTSPFGDPDITDLVPVAVTRINILEMGQELMVVSQTDIDEELLDGDTVTYSSIAADPNSITNTKDVPRAIQINLEGKNKLDQKIINVFIITFTNGCGSHPAFEEGQSAGWMRFTGIGSASNELCAAAPSPTMSPISLAPPAPGTDTTVPTLALKNTTDSPTTSKPSSGTFVPAVEIPTDPFATISMSMSMSMSLDILQFDLEDAIRPNSREFGGWKALRNTRTKDGKKGDKRDGKSGKDSKIGGDNSKTTKEKNSKTLKGLKGKGDDDDDNKNSKGDKKSSKVEKALKGEHDEKDKASNVTGKLGGKLRRGNT